MIVSIKRGADSSGVALGHKGKNGPAYHYYKGVQTSLELVMDDTFKKMLADKNGKFLLMGHTRAATQGSITKENAQPVVRNQMIGCHNGTIMGLGSPQRSDSVDLYELIDKRGIQAALDRARGGAYALTWVDLRTNKLHMLKNDRRPLYIMYSKGRGTMLWASEEIFLKFVSARNHPARWEDPLVLEDDTLYTFDLSKPSRRTDYTTEDMAPTPFVPQALPPPGPKPKTQSHPGHSSDPLHRYVEKYRTTQTEGKDVSFVCEVQPGKWHTRHTLMPAIEAGCTLCSNAIDLKQDIHWLDGEAPVCPDCVREQAQLIAEYAPGNRLFKGLTKFFVIGQPFPKEH